MAHELGYELIPNKWCRLRRRGVSREASHRSEKFLFGAYPAGKTKLFGGRTNRCEAAPSGGVENCTWQQNRKKRGSNSFSSFLCGNIWNFHPTAKFPSMKVLLPRRVHFRYSSRELRRFLYWTCVWSLIFCFTLTDCWVYMRRLPSHVYPFCLLKLHGLRILYWEKGSVKC